MQGGGTGRAGRASHATVGRLGGAAALMLALAVAGCNTFAQAPLGDVRGTTIAFESIEGPPASLVQKFTRDLNAEASAREIAVVPRGGAALYRIRGYLATGAERDAPSIAWAWDVYDGGQLHTFRLTGAEPTGGRRAAGEWAALDEAALRRIARASIEQLVGFIAANRAAAPAALAYANPGQ